jgi:hypothetical protein
MKLNVVCMECIKCGAMSYPPSDVSDVGQEIYEEVFDAPPLEPERLLADEELKAINKARRAAGLPEFKDVGEWASEYRKWAASYRESRREEALQRLSELKGRLKEVDVAEEAKAFRIRGRRHLAVLETFERGWRLRCPVCGAQLVEARW